MQEVDKLIQPARPLFRWLQAQRQKNRKRFTWIVIIVLFVVGCCCFSVVMNTLDKRGMLPTLTPTITSTKTRLPTYTSAPTHTREATHTEGPKIPATPLPTKTALPTATRTPVPYVAPTLAHPAGKTGRCMDGSYTASQHKRGACSSHGGIAEWWGP